MSDQTDFNFVQFPVNDQQQQNPQPAKPAQEKTDSKPLVKQEQKEEENLDGAVETTLDEPVYVTLWREVKQILYKLFHVAIFCTKTERVLQDWDLWGPMIVCYCLSLLLSIISLVNRGEAKDDKDSEDVSSYVFSIVFVVFWLGSIFISINTKFLGGKLSIPQSVCVVGYCCFPILLGAIVTTICTFIYQSLSWMVGIPLMIGMDVWSSLAAFGFLQGAIGLSRRPLATYPIVLFFTMLAWVTVLVNVHGFIFAGSDDK